MNIVKRLEVLQQINSQLTEQIEELKKNSTESVYNDKLDELNKAISCAVEAEKKYNELIEELKKQKYKYEVLIESIKASFNDIVKNIEIE